VCVCVCVFERVNEKENEDTCCMIINGQSKGVCVCVCVCGSSWACIFPVAVVVCVGMTGVGVLVGVRLSDFILFRLFKEN